MRQGTKWAEESATLICWFPKQRLLAHTGFPGKLCSHLPRAPLTIAGLGPSHSVTSKPQDEPGRQGSESLLLGRNDRPPCPCRSNLWGPAGTVPSSLCPSSLCLNPLHPKGLLQCPGYTALHPSLWDQWICSRSPGKDGASPARGLWEEGPGEGAASSNAGLAPEEKEAIGWKPSDTPALPREICQLLRPGPKGPHLLPPSCGHQADHQPL